MITDAELDRWLRECPTTGMPMVSPDDIRRLIVTVQSLREAISPGRQNAGHDYYIAVAKKMREREAVIRPKASREWLVSRAKAEEPYDPYIPPSGRPLAERESDVMVPHTVMASQCTAVMLATREADARIAEEQACPDMDCGDQACFIQREIADLIRAAGNRKTS